MGLRDIILKLYAEHRKRVENGIAHQFGTSLKGPPPRPFLDPPGEIEGIDGARYYREDFPLPVIPKMKRSCEND